jgi:hypothetical protein
VYFKFKTSWSFLLVWRSIYIELEISWRLHAGPVLICNTIVERLTIVRRSVIFLVNGLVLRSVAPVRVLVLLLALFYLIKRASTKMYPFLVEHSIQEPPNASTSVLVTNLCHPWKSVVNLATWHKLLAWVKVQLCVSGSKAWSFGER